MTRDFEKKRRPLSLIWYLIGFITLIIGIVVAASLAVSYTQAQEEVARDYATLRNNTENNAIESVWLVNTGLELVDADLNPPMERSLTLFAEAYTQSGNDPSRMNLSEIQEQIAPAFSGTVNLYIFSESGVMEYSTLPEVRGIDFRQYPDFYRSLTRIRLGDEFAADPVVRSVQNASDTSVKGTLRKFVYLPSPDHRYVLEIGLESPEFAYIRSRLSYQEMVKRLKAINPDLLGIRVYDYNGNVAAQDGETAPEGQQYAEMAIRNRTGFSVPDAAGDTLNRYLFVDLRDPKAVSDTSVVIELRYSNSRLNAALADLVFRYLVIGLCAILMGIVLAYAAFRQLTGAISEIVLDVEQIAAGDLSHTIRSVNTTEFTRLESGINTMIKQIMVYTEELERKKAELQVAADIQTAFLPKVIPRPAGFDLAAASIPAREVGGDFYDVFCQGNGMYALVIADVAGKGVPASLFMALSRTAVRIVSRWEKTAQSVLNGSNTIFIKDSGSTSFVSVFYAILDADERILTYVNAGHNPPILRRAGGTIEELEPTGPVIGLLDEPGYRERQVALRPGDVLVMFTDGVTEAINRNEEMFSDERLRAVVQESHTLTAAEMVETIQRAVGSFCGNAPQFDDMTIMVLKVE